MRRSWTPDFTNILSRRAHWTRDSDQADLHHRRSIANIQTCESNTSLKDFGSRPGDGVALTQQTCEHLRSQAWLWNRLTALLLKPELHLLRFVVDLWCCTTRYNPQQIQDKNLPKFRTQLKAHTRTHVLSASRHQLKHFCFLHLHSAPSAFDVIYSQRIRSITYLLTTTSESYKKLRNLYNKSATNRSDGVCALLSSLCPHRPFELTWSFLVQWMNAWA